MSPRKLTEDDKQEILQLYRSSEATTSTLATRYEVSSSTISRFLKNKLSSTEYEDLIQQKRLARTPRGEKSNNKSRPKSNSTETSSPAVVESEHFTEEIPKDTATTKPSSRSPRRRRRASAKSQPVESSPVSTAPEAIDAEENDTTEPVVMAETSETESSQSSKSNLLILKGDRQNLEDDDDDDDEVDLITLKEMLGEDLEDINEEDDDDWDEDDDEDDDEAEITYSSTNSTINDLEILPLSQAIFPNTCYLVIDRSAELIVKPLADFADLGVIPQEEVREKTLPVFDNHRIAKRFSHRRERVIKVPDGRMLQKTSRYLQDKGITRLLIDGQIYSLV